MLSSQEMINNNLNNGRSSKFIATNHEKSGRIPVCKPNKGVVGGDGCATQCIIMTSLLETAAFLTLDGDACKSWYLYAGCHRFARPLGSRKIVRPHEPPSSLLSNSYESRMGTQLGKPTLDKTSRYVVFYILHSCYYLII